MANPNPNTSGLKPQQPGTPSHNPKGKPKGTLDMATIVQRVSNASMKKNRQFLNVKDINKLNRRYGRKKVGEAMVWVLASKALTGDVPSFNALKEAGWGRTVNVESQAQVEVVHIIKPEKLQIIQIESAAEQLRQRALKAVEGELVDGVDSPTRTTDIRPLDT